MNSRDLVIISALAMGLGILFLSPYSHVQKDIIDDPASNTYTIHHDEGGIVADYFNRAVNFDKRGTRVVIDGVCASACALYTRDRGACVTDNTSLGFHAVTENAGTAEHPKRGAINQEVTNQVMSIYPEGIQEWIKANGGMTWDMKWLNAPEVYKYLPRCS